MSFPSASRHILVVDDDADLRASVANRHLSKGHQVVKTVTPDGGGNGAS
jgi:CheY-like chemotaxis protein